MTRIDAATAAILAAGPPPEALEYFALDWHRENGDHITLLVDGCLLHLITNGVPQMTLARTPAEARAAALQLVNADTIR